MLVRGVVLWVVHAVAHKIEVRVGIWLQEGCDGGGGQVHVQRLQGGWWAAGVGVEGAG